MAGSLSALGVSMSTISQAATRVAIAVAATRGGRLAGAPARPLADPDFQELLRVAEAHRILGAVAEVVDGGLLPVTDSQHAAIEERHTFWLAHSLRVERVLDRVGALLASARIDTRVLKGVALARLVYRDPAWRVFTDLDLLVAGDRIDAVVQTLARDLEGVVTEPALRVGFAREFGKSVTVRVDDVEVDIHRTLVAGPFGLMIGLDGLFDDPVMFTVGAQHYRALNSLGLYLHACYAVALGDFPVRLGSLRDLIMIDDALAPDITEVVRIATRWRATSVVARAAEITCNVFDLEPEHSLRALIDLSAPRRELWLLRSYLNQSRGYTRSLASLAVIPGLKPRARYARALVAPSTEYLHSRGWAGRTHVRRAIERLRGRP